MPKKSTHSPSGSSFFPPNDQATYRDLLLFEERLKTHALTLNRRKSRYQFFLAQLIIAIIFLLSEVLLNTSFLSVPYQYFLRHALPSVYGPDTEAHLPPYVASGLLFVSVTTLLLFFASGLYSEKIGYANRYVPRVNRALRNFNIAPKPSQVAFPHATGKTVILYCPDAIDTANNKSPGELIFSSRVERCFREAYERYRTAFERKRDERERQAAARTWIGWLLQKLPWNRLAPPTTDSATPTPSQSRVGSLAVRGRVVELSSGASPASSGKSTPAPSPEPTRGRPTASSVGVQPQLYLQGQLLRTKSAFEDNKTSLDETTRKLLLEADRAHSLDEELRECRERLEKERVMRQNADLTVRSAEEKGKDEETARRELQQALESISSRETASKAIISNLRSEKATLERRTRELEVNLQQVISAATPKRKGRARSSSLSDIRINTLERDLRESRASVLDLQAELGKAQEKLRRNEGDLNRVENEKTVLERKMADQMKNMEETLASKDEEIVRLSGGDDLGLALEREEALIQRVEAEEAKVQALELLLSETRDLKAMESALQRAEKRVAAEISKVKGLEEKNAGLSRDMRQVRDALEESHVRARNLKTALDDRDSLVHSLRAQERALMAQVGVQQEEIRSLSATQSTPASSASPRHTYDGPVTNVETVEKLLTAVDRLRNERDDLRRQLDFLQVESKFTIEALENKINSGASSLQGEVQELLERLAKASSRSHKDLSSSAMESSRLSLITSASLVMVEHLQTRVDHDSAAMDQTLAEISRLRSQLQDTTALSEESHHTNHTLQQSLLDLQLRLESGTSNLHTPSGSATICSSGRSFAVSDHGKLTDVTKVLEDAESERNSLRVEVVNLQGDIVSAQNSLKQAEQRYSNLQNQQLSSMSSARTDWHPSTRHQASRNESQLQEDRIAEMTNELEIAMSEKESMVEDCAEAREARDRALRRADDLEDAVETLETQRRTFEEQRDSEVSALVEVWSSTLTKSRSSIARLRAAHEASAANLDMLQCISSERDSALSLLNGQASELELERKSAVAHREEARNAVVALAVVRTANAEDLLAIQQERDRICVLLSATRDELNDRLQEISSLQDQLQGKRTQDLAKNTEQQARHSAEVAELKAANEDLSQLRAELEDELAQSREELRLAAEQHDRLCVDTDAVKEQIAQLQTDHTEELESLRGKLQQVAVDLQEAREAHALTEKASSELSAANAELEDRLDIMSKQRDEDGVLIADLQSQELRRTTHEKDDLEIRLRDARAELSRASTEDRVQLVQVQERVRRLQTEADSLRAQLDQAIADTKCMRAAFETELRESAERFENARAQQDDAQAQLSSLETECDDLETRLQTAMEEKDAVEAKNTNLESEIQRTLSMQRYLESQLKDSAHEFAVAKAELEQAKEKFAHAEREGKAAEIQLTLQAAQHDKAIASLEQEIQKLQTTSSQDEMIRELEGQIGYMDALMRSKTQEIEENDDRFIELHKEKKKLTGKVEVLSRKVQSLQTKLATLRDSATNQDPAQPTASTSKRSPPLAGAATHYTKSSTPASASQDSRGSTRTICVPPEDTRTRNTNPPELQDPLPTAVVAGKKRAAPDDGDEAVPAQGFTSEGVLVKEPNAATTPRRRKSPRTGFTPVRNTTTRPLTTLVAPGGAAAPQASTLL
ncbi:hypothetical protein EI94DRAFT_1794680 [Lactarius quietus]|nr:hypothetical protein EI94DRAFT_1794680 [Lactarius quietus]